MAKTFKVLLRKFSTPVRETKRMNLFTAINDAMRVAMQTDPSAIVFGKYFCFLHNILVTIGIEL